MYLIITPSNIEISLFLKNNFGIIYKKFSWSCNKHTIFRTHSKRPLFISQSQKPYIIRSNLIMHDKFPIFIYVHHVICRTHIIYLPVLTNFLVDKWIYIHFSTSLKHKFHLYYTFYTQKSIILYVHVRVCGPTRIYLVVVVLIAHKPKKEKNDQKKFVKNVVFFFSFSWGILPTKPLWYGALFRSRKNIIARGYRQKIQFSLLHGIWWIWFTISNLVILVTFLEYDFVPKHK